MYYKQAEKLKSCEMKEGWMKNEEWWRMVKDEWRRMMISSLWGVSVTDGQTKKTDERTDKEIFSKKSFKYGLIKIKLECRKYNYYIGCGMFKFSL